MSNSGAVCCGVSAPSVDAATGSGTSRNVRSASRTSASQTRPREPVARQSCRLMPRDFASRRATGVASTPLSSSEVRPGTPDRVGDGASATVPPAERIASWTSATEIRPSRPVPVTRPRSIDNSSASRRECGVANTSPFVCPRSESGTAVVPGVLADACAAGADGVGVTRGSAGVGCPPGDRSGSDAGTESAPMPVRNSSISASETAASADTARTAPTGNVAPGLATMRRSAPSNGASNSLVILLVSISQIRSPFEKGVPSSINHSVTVPSSMDRPHLGTSISLMSLMVRRSPPCVPRPRCVPRWEAMPVRARGRTAPGCAVG